MTYSKVERSHIVPRCYLRQFAHGGLIGTRLKGEAKSQVIPIKKVATRKRFYRRIRPDGTPIDDVEWALGQIERAVAPILGDIVSRWPLSFEDEKPKLAEFFGMQLVRTPRWRDWHEAFTTEFLNEQHDLQPAPSDDELVKVRSAIDLNALEEWLRDDTQRLVKMIGIAWKIAGIFGSMHWTLVEFRSPLVATSDHPVVVWPRSEGARPPQPTPFNAGLFEALEVRVPVTPTAAILMTWLDAPDGFHDRVTGARHHAQGLNAFTVAEAERQWFHLPGTTPPVGSGSFRPLSAELVPMYDAAAVPASSRRSEISALIQPKIGSEVDDPSFHMVTVRARTP